METQTSDIVQLYERLGLATDVERRQFQAWQQPAGPTAPAAPVSPAGAQPASGYSIRLSQNSSVPPKSK